MQLSDIRRLLDAFACRHHLPGGMTGTLKIQLAQYDYRDETTIKDLLDHLLTLRRPRRIHVRRADGEISLSR